jgi:hypothetical protein
MVGEDTYVGGDDDVDDLDKMLWNIESEFSGKSQNDKFSQIMKDHAILNMAYLDPTIITKALVIKKLEKIENYIVDFFSRNIRTSDTYSYLTPSNIHLTTQ